MDFANRKKDGNSAEFSITKHFRTRSLEIIKSLPLNVATGFDGISSPSIKLIAPEVAPSLARVINCIMINSICPAQLTLARATPIYKRGVKPLLTKLQTYISPPGHLEDSR